MSKEKEVNLKEIKKAKAFGIAYNEKNFLLAFSESEKYEDGYGYTIPATELKRIVEGIIETGKEYQKAYGKDIGFEEGE